LLRFSFKSRTDYTNHTDLTRINLFY